MLLFVTAAAAAAATTVSSSVVVLIVLTAGTEAAAESAAAESAAAVVAVDRRIVPAAAAAYSYSYSLREKGEQQQQQQQQQWLLQSQISRQQQQQLRRKRRLQKQQQQQNDTEEGTRTTSTMGSNGSITFYNWFLAFAQQQSCTLVGIHTGCACNEATLRAAILQRQQRYITICFGANIRLERPIVLDNSDTFFNSDSTSSAQSATEAAAVVDTLAELTIRCEPSAAYYAKNHPNRECTLSSASSTSRILQIDGGRGKQIDVSNDSQAAAESTTTTPQLSSSLPETTILFERLRFLQDESDDNGERTEKEDSSQGDGGCVLLKDLARHGFTEIAFIECHFVGCYSETDGGAVSLTTTIDEDDAKDEKDDELYSSQTIFTKCTFHNNTAGTSGGAISIAAADENSVIVDNCQFAGNRASLQGGAISIVQSPATKISSRRWVTLLLKNSTFTNNAATDHSSMGGALFLSGDGRRTTIRESHFVRNSANAGGAIASTTLSDNNKVQRPTISTLTNVTFVENTAAFTGGAILATKYSQMRLSGDTTIFQNNNARIGSDLSLGAFGLMNYNVANNGNDASSFVTCGTGVVFCDSSSGNSRRISDSANQTNCDDDDADRKSLPKSTQLSSSSSESTSTSLCMFLPPP